MSQPYRQAKGGRIDRSREISFTYNGNRYTGYQGDTLASALLANGIDVVGRSFKYSRPRGIVAAGAEEPNAIMQVGASEATQVPNVRATQQALYEGLVCSSVNGWPNVDNDLMGYVGKLGGSMMPPGFYYKTFMFPESLWMTYEKYIRKAAGLGRAPKEVDPDIYDKMHHHCEVLIVGAGAAGLMAALTASRGGARVILADEQEEMGGALLHSSETINGQPAAEWVQATVSELSRNPDVMLLPRSTVNGYHDHNFVTIHERRTDHMGDRAPLHMSRQRLHKVRADWVILATGAHERPLVYGNNDVPGNMLAGAVTTYVRRYGVVPGKKLVLMTTNDHGYNAALAWKAAGAEVVAIVDTRNAPEGDLIDAARAQGIRIMAGSVVTEIKGSKRVSAALVAPISSPSATQSLDCDTLASSGGYSPVVHLSCHTGSRPVWDDSVIGFVPGAPKEQRLCAGAVQGKFTLESCLSDGIEQAATALTSLGKAVPSIEVPEVTVLKEGKAMALFQVPHAKSTSRGPKQFVDLQNDVTAAGIELATREGFESIEHVKRYTAMGFGTDQGKLGNINGMAIAAKALGKTIPETGTTIFRPNYTPISFGAVVGRDAGHLFDVKRYTAMHPWHLANGALFEDVGQWKRPWYYPQGNEDLHAAVNRECMAVRNGVGILDASTLGKIDIQGPDAREFLNRIYTNAWLKLNVGKCRYGLMCHEDGMVFDDGVTSCLGENHFLMTTTTGGAAGVLDWLELWHQTEWPELDVYFSSVTDHWATMTISGPKARNLLAELTDDIDLDKDTFKFMDWRAGTVAGVPARVFRISFTGELSYEINVQANFGLAVWKKLFEHGEKYNLTPYGTETMHVLRAEKGFIIVGQDTDGSVTPHDLNMSWAVGNNKPFSFIGQRGMQREDCLRDNRKQLVGLVCTNPKDVLPEGAHLVDDPNHPKPMPMLGHVTSSYYSANLDQGIAMALIKGGLKRMGEKVYAPLRDGRVLECVITSSVFLDPKGDRQNV
ncbi:sarcosine oxidase subunit alpha [Pokkaliibacter sp. CJK22405]|uniref:sarcosine oxidase subunit alpha n=1 Tax=Pokkaliibacter sp. CJK22405 TaxID=3384615 RepID=UPI00398539CA